MTIFVTASAVGVGIQVNVLADDLVVIAGVTLVSTGDNAIQVTADYTHLRIDGNVWSAFAGLKIAGPTSEGGFISVGASGSLYGTYYGVQLSGPGNTLSNDGSIAGGHAGVFVSMVAGLPQFIRNAGTISGDFIGIEATGTGTTGNLTIINTGLIRGDDAWGGAIHISYGGMSSDDTIRNRGEIIGYIYLGNGHDIYDGRGGTVDGVVYGREDNDTFIAGLSEESFDGGTGIDLLDFSKSAGVTVSLDNSVAGTRGAEGDTYVAIEDVTGSRFGADKLYGDGGANRLSGLGGQDALFGGLGNDTLTGGNGKDALTGGFNSDAFVFGALAECGDTITDFAAALGNDDVIWITAAAFGGGLVAGALSLAQMQVSLDNVAVDTSVRFIFNSTDKSLWFDANGSAAGGLTMVADLQANAAFGIADILLV